MTPFSLVQEKGLSFFYFTKNKEKELQGREEHKGTFPCLYRFFLPVLPEKAIHVMVFVLVLLPFLGGPLTLLRTLRI